MTSTKVNKLTPYQQKWVDALRSGEYKKGKGRLKIKHEDGECFHCCLGVAQELFGQEKIRMIKRDGEDIFTSNREYPTNDVVDILDLRDHKATISPNQTFYEETGYSQSLSTANDRGLSFEHIADFIEQNPESVFKQGSE